MGTAEAHLWELIKEESGEKIFTLRFKEQKICDLETEFICKYGMCEFIQEMLFITLLWTFNFSLLKHISAFMFPHSK